MNHVHIDIKYLVSVIITLGIDISRGDTVFYDGVKSSDFGSRFHILKHLHGRMVFVHLKNNSMKVLYGVDTEPYFP